MGKLSKANYYGGTPVDLTSESNMRARAQFIIGAMKQDSLWGESEYKRTIEGRYAGYSPYEIERFKSIYGSLVNGQSDTGWITVGEGDDAHPIPVSWLSKNKR